MSTRARFDSPRPPPRQTGTVGQTRVAPWPGALATRATIGALGALGPALLQLVLRHSLRRLLRPLLLGLLAGLPWVAQAQLPATGDPEASPRWQAVRASLFGQRAIAKADEVLTLQAPARAIDASAVPIVLGTRFGQSPARHIAKVWLIIDANPSPIAAIFSYTLASGKADIETRVRIDEYSFVRAVAELGDGSLVMAVKHVKASGGCSAAPGKDAEAAAASLGRMAWRVDGDARIGQPVLAQLSISHPNDTGMVMDQLARTYTPAHYVRRIDVSYAGQPVLSADVDFAISENPNLRLWFVPQGPGDLTAEVSDTQQRRFETRLALRPAP